MTGVETRGAARDSLFLMAELAVDGESARHRVKIRNLSARGLMAEGEVSVSRGSRVQIDARGAGMLRGTVAWREGARFGIAFEDEVEPDRIREALVTPREAAPKLAPYAPRVNSGRKEWPDPRKLRQI